MSIDPAAMALSLFLALLALYYFGRSCALESQGEKKSMPPFLIGMALAAVAALNLWSALGGAP